MQCEWQGIEEVIGKLLVKTWLLCGHVYRKYAWRLKVASFSVEGQERGDGFWLAVHTYWMLQALLSLHLSVWLFVIETLRNAGYFIKTSFWGKDVLSKGNSFPSEHSWGTFGKLLFFRNCATPSWKPISRMTRDQIRCKDTLFILMLGEKENVVGSLEYTKIIQGRHLPF